MSKSDRQKKREQRRNRHAKPSMPRAIGANDNAPEAGNDNEPVIVGGVTLNGRLSAVFRKADADLTSADPTVRREAHQALLEIELAITQELDAQRMQAVRKEIADLERRRGGQLTVEQARDKRGEDGERLKVSRDGLTSIVNLPVHKHAAALRYRADYERVDPEKGLTPPVPTRAAPTHGGGDGYAKKVAESWGRMRTIHLMIAGVSISLDPDARPNMPNLPANHPAMRSITALQEIAGKGRAPSDMTSSGSVKARIREDLIRGLSVCEIVYGLE